MSGALVDLVSRGVQDAYITGNPEVSFFRQTYKRHTNFACKPVEIIPHGNLSANSEVSLKIPNKGDLLSYVWMDLGDNGSVQSNLQSNTVSPVIFELWIGGQMIDRQDSTFQTYHWNNFLADSNAKVKAFNADTEVDAGANKWFPLHFFFCDNYPLPLVALQYHEVEIRVKFSSGNPSAVKFYANYILLDTDERDYFVNKEHEILINQVQRIPATTGSDGAPGFDLSLLNHPVKSLHWSNVIAHGTATSSETNQVMIYLNGTQLFESEMPNRYFQKVQGYYHSEVVSGMLSDDNSSSRMYSFACKANKHQPTGSCNFSRLDNAEMKIGSASGIPKSNIFLYANNLNILRIKNGMAGVAFGN